ncbi:MAG: hypothetical protein SVP52_08865 [Chloroflexota bacterium]|nr:hypothetical protein [Chloroflexota bacterium]
MGLQTQIWPAQLGINPDIGTATKINDLVVGPLLAFGISALLGILVFIVTNVNMLQSIFFFLPLVVGFGGWSRSISPSFLAYIPTTKTGHLFDSKYSQRLSHPQDRFLPGGVNCT